MQDIFIYDTFPLGGPWKVALKLSDPTHLYIINTATGELVQFGAVVEWHFPEAIEEAQKRNEEVGV